MCEVRNIVGRQVRNKNRRAKKRLPCTLSSSIAESLSGPQVHPEPCEAQVLTERRGLPSPHKASLSVLPAEGLHHFPDIVNSLLENLHIRKPCDVQRNDCLPSVARGFGVLCVVHHVLSKCGAVKRSSQQTEHQRQSISFRAPDRH